MNALDLIRLIKNKSKDELIKEKYKNMEKLIICTNKNCDEIKKQYNTNPELKKLHSKGIIAKNDKERDKIHNEIMKIKIAKDYYNCLYEKCKKKFIISIQSDIKEIEKNRINKYGKSQKELLEKIKNIANKNFKEITYDDIITIKNIKEKLIAFSLKIK